MVSCLPMTSTGKTAAAVGDPHARLEFPPMLALDPKLACQTYVDFAPTRARCQGQARTVTFRR